MFKVIGQTIHLTRGDTAVLTITIKNVNGENYTLITGDKVVLTVRKTTTDKTIIIRKEFADNKITILPDETADLTYGDYVYDVQFTGADGHVDTIITPHLFKILEEVTY